MIGKEISFSSTPPQMRKELALYDNPFLALEEEEKEDAKKRLAQHLKGGENARR